MPLAVLVVQGGPGTMKSVAQIASKGHPIIVMVDAGGAGTAIHQYVTGGLGACEPNFRSMVAYMEEIHQANLSKDGMLLTFFSLNGDNERDLSKVTRSSIALLSPHQHISPSPPHRQPIITGDPLVDRLHLPAAR